METIIGIIVVGLIVFITYKMVKASKKTPTAPPTGGTPKPKEEDGIPLPNNPKLRE